MINHDGGGGSNHDTIQTMQNTKGAELFVYECLFIDLITGHCISLECTKWWNSGNLYATWILCLDHRKNEPIGDLIIRIPVRNWTHFLKASQFQYLR